MSTNSVLVLSLLLVPGLALAQEPAPLEPPPPVDAPPQLAEPAPVDEPPPVEEPAPAPVAPAVPPVTASREEPGSCWGPLCSGAGACAAVDVVGGGLTALGCLFASIGPAGGGDICLEDCILGIISAGMVVFGVLLGAVGVIALGPVAALVVTAAVAIASAIAGRAYWGAALGGIPGLLVGIGGVALAGYGLSQMDISSSGALEPGLFSPDPLSGITLVGLGLAAVAGPLALAGALGGEGAWTLFLDDGEPAAPPPAAVARSERARHELPLRLVAVSSPVAY